MLRRPTISLTRIWKSYANSFDIATAVHACRPLPTLVPVIAFWAILVFLKNVEPLRTFFELESIIIPGALIVVAGIFSLGSWAIGESRKNLLALLQFFDVTFFAASVIGVSAFSRAPAMYIFAGVYALCCFYWGTFYAPTLLAFLSIAIGPAVFMALDRLDACAQLIVFVGLVFFHASSIRATYARKRKTLATRSEDVLAKLEALIVEQNTNQQMQEGCAILVHDLKNRLVPSYFDIEEALRMVSGSKPRELISRSLEDVKQLIVTMESYLGQDEFGKREASWFPLDELRDEAELLAEDCRDGVRIEVDKLPHTFVGGQADLVAISFRNLITNSIEAGASTIKLTGRLSDDQCSVVITVADDGPGLPPKVAENLFKPYNTHGKAHGVGLGIYLAGQIIRAAGGRIELAETGRKGTAFRIELPVFVPETGQPAVACAETPGTGAES